MICRLLNHRQMWYDMGVKNGSGDMVCRRDTEAAA